MTLKVCKKCGKVVAMNKEMQNGFGYDTTIYTCPKCGHIETEQINKIHYGNDELKK